MTATEAGQPAMDPEDGGQGSAGTDQIAFGRDAAGARPARDARGDAHTAERIAALRARLMSPMPDDRLWGWLGPLIITAFAAFTRFYRLSIPHAVVFDETYYAKDAWSILQHGVEWQYVKNANDLILAGNTSHLYLACSGTSCGEYVVQPPVGKLLIAVGEWIYGLTPLGWRVAPALFGTLAVLVMCRVARRLTRSTLLGCVAGLLLSLDGLEFVLSRTGILDIFLMFFVLAAFGAMLVDRDVSRARLASAMVLEPSDEAGPQLGIRKWRIAAGVLIGLACASKQDAIWYLLAFIGLAVAWDIGARRAAGLRQYVRGALVRDGKWLPVTLMAIPLVTYVATWTGWLVTSTGYDRNYAQQHGITTPVISQLYSLYEYHKEIYGFMTQPEPAPPVSVPAVGLVRDQPAGGVLLPVLHERGGNQDVPERVHRPGVVVGGARDRQPGHLVGGHRGDPVLPRLVVHPQGLAGRGRGALRRRRLGDLAAVPLAHQVLLLRARVRAVHDLVHRAVPGPDHRPGRGEPATPCDRLGTRRHLRACRPSAVLVFLSDTVGEDHSVFSVAVAHVVHRLDLARRNTRRNGATGPRGITQQVLTWLSISRHILK